MAGDDVPVPQEMNTESATTAIAIACLTVWGLSQLRRDVEPPKSPHPERQVIQPEDVDAPPAGEAPAPVEDEPLYYTQIGEACQVASETERPLLVVVSRETPPLLNTRDDRRVTALLHPDEQAQGYGTTYANMFAKFALPVAFFVPVVRWGSTTSHERYEFVDLDDFGNSLAEAWKKCEVQGWFPK